MEHQALLSSQPPERSRASAPAPSARRGLRSLAGFLFLGISIGSFTACAPTGSRPSPPAPPVEQPGRRGAPDWAGMPLGWQKLDEIERWLRIDTQRYDPFWRVQGELILSEGRLAFAKDDLAAGKIDENTLRERAALAREGFERVLADGRANDAQRARAEKGVAQLAGLAPPAPQTSYAFVPRSAWKARAAINSRLDPVGGSWTRITVHHSDSVPGTRLDGTLADSLEALRKIQRNHQDNEGWGDIGYHYLVDGEGRVLEGRSLQWQGAHAGGENNVRNIGVCLLGDFEQRAPSADAFEGLEKLLDELRARHGIARGNVICHRDLKSTVCPGDRVAAWVRGYEGGEKPKLTASAGSARRATPASWSSSAKGAASASSGSGVVR